MRNIKNKLKSLFAAAVLLGVSQYAQAQAVGTPYIVPIEQGIPFSFLAGGTIAKHNTNDVQQTPDGGYITIGTTDDSGSGDITGTNHGGDDVWVVKYDQYGKKEWNRLYGGSSFDHGHAIIPTTDGGYIFTATVNTSGMSISPGTGDVMAYPTNHALAEIWVVKLNAAGNIMWQRLYGGNGADIGRTILQLTDGSYIVGGMTSSSASGDITGTTVGGDLWVFRITSTGNIIWQQIYNGPGPNGANDFLDSLVATSDGTGYILGGRSFSNYRSTGGQDFSIMKISLTGGLEWQKLYGTAGLDQCFSAYPTSDGGSIIAGISNGSATGDTTLTNHGGNDMWIIKLNSLGNIEWQRLLGGAGNDNAHSVVQTVDGGFMLAGSSQPSSAGNGDITALSKGGIDVCIFKLSADGSIEWQRLYGGPGIEGDNGLLTYTRDTEFHPTELRKTADGDYIIFTLSTSDNSADVTDTKNGSGAARYNIWLFKIDPMGNIVEVPDVGQKD